MAVSVLLLLVVLTASLSPCVLSARDSKGTEFIFGFTENFEPSLTDVAVYITTSSNTSATVTVTTPFSDPAWSETTVLSGMSSTSFSLPSAIRGVGIEKGNRGVLVQSSMEVSVYAVNLEPTSTDAFLALPVDVLGMEYYAMTDRRNPALMLIGVEDNTQVSITWPRLQPQAVVSVTYDGVTYANGETMTVTLNRLETFHALQDSDDADFTGVHIVSNKPVAVVSGNQFPSVPLGNGPASHLTEMLAPVDTWGQEFVSTIGDMYRVVASVDDTHVQFGDNVYNLMFAGDFKEYDITTDQYITINASKPVEVGMFTKSGQNDGNFDRDPAMTLLSPVSQFASNYTWVAVRGGEGDFTNIIVIIIEDSQKSGLLLDGQHVSWEEEAPVAGSSKVHMWTFVSPGIHNIYHNHPLVTFMAYAAGTGSGTDSYAFLAGQRLDQINIEGAPICRLPVDLLNNAFDGMMDLEEFNFMDMMIGQNKKTCELTGGQVTTFDNNQGLLNYKCLFKAATLHDDNIYRDTNLIIDIYAAHKDTDADGVLYVSEVVVDVEETGSGVSRKSNFTIKAEDIRNVFNGLTQFQSPEDLWTIEGEYGLREKAIFEYSNGRVSFAFKSNLYPVLTFQPLIHSLQETPYLEISAIWFLQQIPEESRFPKTLCSNQGSNAFEGPFNDLENVQQKILYALLDQDVQLPQSDPQCTAAIQAFKDCSEDGKREAAMQCVSALPEDLADCIQNADAA